MMKVAIYNLFPRLFGRIERWLDYLPVIKDMGFNWIYINPFHYPGFSGSLYAPKDYYKINPLFGDNLEDLKIFINKAHSYNIRVMMDLVINHTAKDSPLTVEHADWYKKDENGNIKSPGAWDNGKYIEWGDLAEIENDNSPSREYLWKYWLDLILYFLEYGFDGFRCDAAYQVSDKLWRYLITNSKAKYPEIKFFGETLGCKIEDIIKLGRAGFDYGFNSARWWNFKDEWFIEQYNQMSKYMPSISFIESHDTERAFSVYREKELYLYFYFTSFVSSGWMITSGFEYGFKKRLNVVTTLPSDWEEINYDMRDKIKFVNKIREEFNIFNIDVPYKWYLDNGVSILIKENGEDKVIFLINNNKEKKYINLKKYLKNDLIYNILFNREESIDIENYALEEKGIEIFYEKEK